MQEGREQAKAWLRAQTRAGARAARLPILFGLAGTGFAITQAWYGATVLSAALDHTAAWRELAVFIALALLRALLGYAAELTAADAGAAGRRRLRSDALARLLHAPITALRYLHSGQMSEIVTDRIEAVDGLFARWLPAAVLALAGPALVLAVLASMDVTAALILFGIGLTVPLGMALGGIGAAAQARGQFQALARLQARFLDRVRGIATLIAHGAVEREATALAAAANELRWRTMRVLRVAFLSGSVLDLAAAGAIAVTALRYAGGWFAGQHGPLPLFALFLVSEFFAPLRAFTFAYQDRLHATAAADVLASLPASETPMSGHHGPQRQVRSIGAQGVSVAFEDVSFTWDPARGKALDAVSFRVPAGETLILAGPSGAGKSTVLEILLGFARPDTGRVTINGADLTDLVPAALSRLTAWVGQRPVLFAGSIRDNIRFARPEASDADIARAARLAQVAGFAASLPDGLDTEIGEGGFGLSGGQAQRVAIARAFLKDAPLLLLDEPTAHLDPSTESDVLDSLRHLAAGRTVLLASHSAAANLFSGRRLDLHAGRLDMTRGVA